MIVLSILSRTAILYLAYILFIVMQLPHPFAIELVVIVVCAFAIALMPSKYFKQSKVVKYSSIVLWITLCLGCFALFYSQILSEGFTLFALPGTLIPESMLILLLSSYVVAPGNHSAIASPVHLILIVPLVAAAWFYGLASYERDIQLSKLDALLSNWTSDCTHDLCTAAPYFGLAAVPEAESIAYYALNDPERESILDSTDILLLFRDEDFQTLDDYFERFNAGFNSGDITEATYLAAFSTDIFYEFSVDDRIHVQRWVEASPDSYLAHGLLALYHYHLGWKHRGTAFGSEVSFTQFEVLYDQMDLAHTHFSEALSLNPNFMVAHRARIELVKVLPYDAFPEPTYTPSNSLLVEALNRKSLISAEDALTRRYLDEALEFFPASHGIHTVYIGSLLPRWGGSHERMRQFALESQVLVSENPRLRSLLSYEFADKANILNTEGRDASAIKLYQDAKYHGVVAEYLIMEARAQQDIYEWYEKLDIHTNIIENYNRSNPEAWLDLGYENYRNDQFEEAERYYLGALQADASYYWIQSTVYYLYQINPGMIRAWIDNELSINPRNIHLQYANAYALFLERDRDTVSAFSTFLNSCDREYCESGVLDSARIFEACFADSPDCTLERELYEFAL